MGRRLVYLAVGVTLAAMSNVASAKDPVPVSSGELQYRLDGERIGEEQFRVYRDKRLVIETTRTLYYPEPVRQELRYELEKTLEPRKLEMSAVRGGIVTELKLERKGENWRVEVKGQGRKSRKHELGRYRETVVDFDSPLFNSLAVRRLGLGPEQHGQVEAITLALPDFDGARASQTYRRVEDEEIEGPNGLVQAAVYEIEVGESNHKLWVDPSGIALKGVFERPLGELEVVLVRMKAKAGTAWP
jgi:hypothetical protein